MENSHLITTDLATVATLVTMGFSIVEMKKIGPAKTSFSFSKERGIDEVMDRYWARDLMVDARTFFENLKMIKTRISQLNYAHE